MSERVLLSHGGGGRIARDLITELILPAFDNPVLARLEDASTLSTASPRPGSGRLVMTTDSFVVTPLFFPGGDIGTLAVSGTVNDLAAVGAAPLALSVGLILEEGFSIEDLKRILLSMKRTADSVPVPLITGDTKVVEQGRGDGVYINTAGVGLVKEGVSLSPANIQPGDAVLVNGPIGSHEACILAERNGFEGAAVSSDCAPLSSLVQTALEAVPELRCARDPTRGGVASVLSEITESSGFDIVLDETRIPVSPAVQGLCDILGMDPLMMANEGKMLFFVPAERADRCIQALSGHALGRQSAVIGTVIKTNTERARAGKLSIRTSLGTTRLVTMPSGDQLPRIC